MAVWDDSDFAGFMAIFYILGYMKGYDVFLTLCTYAYSSQFVCVYVCYKLTDISSNYTTLNFSLNDSNVEIADFQIRPLLREKRATFL